MTDKLHGAVVVITGASSGIGRVTARMFATRGAKLVLAARDRSALEEVARLCDDRGAQTLVVPTDIKDESQVTALSDAAVQRFGGIDVWINNAAVSLMGPFECVPTPEIRAVLDTNIMGTVHGTKAALSHFRQRGRGTVITVGSVAGKVPYPQASAYCASKHAIHALMAAIRQELVGSKIDVCVVAPATVDTPFFDHLANYTGRQIRAMPPVYRPERVARAIVNCAEHPRREVFVGAAPVLMSLSQVLTPWLFERVLPRLIDRLHLGRYGAPVTKGNLEHSTQPHAERAGWKEGRRDTAERFAPPAPTPQLVPQLG
ncbi:MAG TPA: SDR family oxidoreductase [Labilithrix sp.]|nr:SDR family oxidoreductase [Labilithrix sp.]